MARAPLFVAARVRRFFEARDAVGPAKTDVDEAITLYNRRIEEEPRPERIVLLALSEDYNRKMGRLNAARAELAAAEAALRELAKQ